MFKTLLSLFLFHLLVIREKVSCYVHAPFHWLIAADATQKIIQMIVCELKHFCHTKCIQMELQFA